MLKEKIKTTKGEHDDLSEKEVALYYDTDATQVTLQRLEFYQSEDFLNEEAYDLDSSKLLVVYNVNRNGDDLGKLEVEIPRVNNEASYVSIPECVRQAFMSKFAAEVSASRKRNTERIGEIITSINGGSFLDMLPELSSIASSLTVTDNYTFVPALVITTGTTAEPRASRKTIENVMPLLKVAISLNAVQFQDVLKKPTIMTKLVSLFASKGSSGSADQSGHQTASKSNSINSLFS